MTAGGHLNASETRSREAVSRLPDRLARLCLASLRFRKGTALRRGFASGNGQSLFPLRSV